MAKMHSFAVTTPITCLAAQRAALPPTAALRKLSEGLRTSRGEVRLKKDLSHLFRSRFRPPSARLDVRAFNEILEVDEAAGTVDVEGMTSYEKLAEATFAYGLVPPGVVPQLKSITIGGACAGLGIEASSFRYGLTHETVEEIEVVLADGDIVVCTPTNAYSDLFFRACQTLSARSAML